METGGATAGTAAALPFEFAEFHSWYDETVRARLMPAELTFTRILKDEIQKIEVEFGTGRFRPTQSRIKDPLRLWTKINSDKYSGKIHCLEDIASAVDDLVGIRVVCTNKSDVTRLRQVLERFDEVDSDGDFGVALEAGSVKDYISNPKPSGYRAFHVNLLTKVPRRAGLATVRGELQVRTLLQDGWGELTHEDTYKPGQEVPRLVRVLSQRMGELLATVDDIAQDIQEELRALAQEVVGQAPLLSSGPGLEEPSWGEPAEREIRPERQSESASDPDSTSLESKDSREGRRQYPEVSPGLVLAEAARLAREGDRPIALASIANSLQSTFGTGIRHGWLGYGEFKDFLRAAVPGVHIAPIGPSYVLPQGVEPNDSWPDSVLKYLEEIVEKPRNSDSVAGSF